MTNTVQQSSLREIIDSENELLKEAPGKYGEYFTHAVEALKLIQSFITGVTDEAWVFLAFLSQLRNHLTLAFLSTIRLHHVQTVMNLRQVMESGANASYALAVPNPYDFVITTPEGLLEMPGRFKAKRYAWLEKNYPKGSAAIRAMKDNMQLSSHSNFLDTQRTFKFEAVGKGAEIKTPFFDFENEFQIKGDLWSIANITMGLVDLFYGVNLDSKRVAFQPDFVTRLQLFEKENNRLKLAMMQTDRYRRADERAVKRDERLKGNKNADL